MEKNWNCCPTVQVVVEIQRGKKNVVWRRIISAKYCEGEEGWVWVVFLRIESQAVGKSFLLLGVTPVGWGSQWNSNYPVT